MEKRTSPRLPVHLDITYTLWNPLFWKKRFSGTIENISEKGFYIRTETEDFPLDSLLEVFLTEKVTVPARSSTIVRKECSQQTGCTGLGVALTEPPETYIQFVQSIGKPRRS